MKHLLVFISFLAFCNFSYADISADVLSRWRVGFKIATQPHFDRVSTLEATTPTLFGKTGFWALHLSYTVRDTESNQSDAQFGADVLNLMLEARRPFYKDIASSYVRFGAGYTFISNKAIYNDDGFFSVPFDIGMEIITGNYGWTSGGYSSFFVQLSIDANFLESAKKKAAYETTFDSAALGAGFRIYF